VSSEITYSSGGHYPWKGTPVEEDDDNQVGKLSCVYTSI